MITEHRSKNALHFAWTGLHLLLENSGPMSVSRNMICFCTGLFAAFAVYTAILPDNHGVVRFVERLFSLFDIGNAMGITSGSQ